MVDDKSLLAGSVGTAVLGELGSRFLSSDLGIRIYEHFSTNYSDLIYMHGLSEFLKYGGLAAVAYAGAKYVSDKVYSRSNKGLVSNLAGASAASAVVEYLSHNPDYIQKFRNMMFEMNSYSPGLEDLVRDTSRAGMYVLPVVLAAAVLSGMFSSKKE